MKIIKVILLIFPYFIYSQITEINKIDDESNSSIKIIESSKLNRKSKKNKIDSINNIRFEKYSSLIAYYNGNPEKQYFLKKADPKAKSQSFREGYYKNLNKKYLTLEYKSYSTTLNFTITPQGKLLNSFAEGENSNFNLLSVIALYKLLLEFEPKIPNDGKILDKNQKLTMQISVD